MIAHGRSHVISSKHRRLVGLLSLALAGAWMLSGCSSAAPVVETLALTETPQPSATLVPSATPEPPTATPSPLPSETAAPTETPVPALALLADGLSGYCLPSGFAIPAAASAQVLNVPAEGRRGRLENGALNLSIPATSCSILFRFNQSIPQGTMVRFYHETGSDAWLEAPLTPVQDNPQSAAVVITNTYFVEPPYWEVIYRYVVSAPDGSEAAAGPVRVYRPFPGLCWEGSMPDPVTLSCPVADPKEREPHPDITLPVGPPKE